MLVHGFPFRPLDTFEDGLTNSMPDLIFERWPQSAVSHILGVDERARCTFFFSSQCQIMTQLRRVDTERPCFRSLFQQ